MRKFFDLCLFRSSRLFSVTLIRLCFAGIGLLSACSSSDSTPRQNFFPVDGQWTLKKISCPAAPISPVKVEQINSRINQRKLYYLMSVSGRDITIQQRLFPDPKEDGFCESEIKIKLKELPSHAFKFENIEVVYEKTKDIDDASLCPKRSDLSTQRDNSFELRESELRVFQTNAFDTQNICAGTSPMVSQFERIF